jgi:hypothetical protein
MSPKAKRTEQEAVSWAPEDQEAGGGLITDVDVDFKSVDCEEWDYNGKVETPVPALHILMVDAEGEEHHQYLSCGSLEKIVPSEDGSTFVPAEGSSTKGIPASSNGGIFMRSLGDCGYPFTSDQGLPDDYDPRNIRQLLQGMNAHILRVPQPKRPGIAEPEAKPGKRAFPKESLTVTKINRYPWDKQTKGKATTSKGKVGPKGKAAVEEDDDATTAAVEVVTELLSSKKYAKSGINVEDDLFNVVFAAVKQRPDRKAICAAIQEESFLEREEFTVEDGVLTLA